MSNEVLYADGGVIGSNPSARGGTWAWCLVRDGVRAEEESGVLPCEMLLPSVTNNVSELYAAVRALESRPSGWTGTIYTDSQTTVYRVARPAVAKMHGVPGFLIDRLRAVRTRLGLLHIRLVGGHPTAEELAEGHRGGGSRLGVWRGTRVPVSVHNVWCDQECSRLAARQLRGAHEGPAPLDSEEHPLDVLDHARDRRALALFSPLRVPPL